jgi:hypothetical protein
MMREVTVAHATATPTQSVAPKAPMNAVTPGGGRNADPTTMGRSAAAVSQKVRRALDGTMAARAVTVAIAASIAIFGTRNGTLPRITRKRRPRRPTSIP